MLVGRDINGQIGHFRQNTDEKSVSYLEKKIYTFSSNVKYHLKVAKHVNV